MSDWNTDGGGHQVTYAGTASGEATIANGKAISGAVDVRQFRHVSFVVKGAWTAGSMAFKAADTATAATFWPVYAKDNTLPRVPTKAGTLYATNDIVGEQHFIKFWAEDGSAGTVAQGAERTIKYYLKS